MATVSPIQLQKHLKGMDYPAGKDQLVSHAESHGAPDEVLQALRNIPDRQYDGPGGVSSAVGDQA